MMSPLPRALKTSDFIYPTKMPFEVIHRMNQRSNIVLATLLLVAVSISPVVAAEPIEDVHIVLKAEKIRGYRGINGDLIQLKDGPLLFCYTEYGDGGGIFAKTSPDQGKTWSESKLLVAQPQSPRPGKYNHPSLLQLKSGELLMTYNYSTHPAKPYYAVTLYRRSEDQGATWSEQLPVTPYAGYTLVHNDKLLALADGRIVVAAATKKYMPSSHDHNGYVGLTFFSDDQGYSWHPSKNEVDLYASAKIEVQEPDVVELKDGRLLMFARTYSGHPVKAYSKDRGETWSKGEMIRELKMPYAGLPTVRRIPSTGDLLFIWISGSSKSKSGLPMRSVLSTAISQDEGKTFVHQRNLVDDPADDVGYQCIEFLEDGKALIVYHTNDGLHLSRLNVDWFYGK
ncbi:Sialidase precursor [Novipirellula galeiformis]|uniref:Sialidase n=1 Tax=Novipirellula galeiformis TaxID=2528004 RepID=A0A5C6CQY5_9BACT|nr:sialidase family protein [Novipirellula galeiformis]TWU25259.1 Sialidase precursor [Novipirellula galeiformis]